MTLKEQAIILKSKGYNVRQIAKISNLKIKEVKKYLNPFRYLTIK